MNDDQKLAYKLLLPPFFFLIALNTYPFFYGIYLSLNAGFLKRFIGLTNFAEVLRDPLFWDSLRVTFTYSGFAVSIELALGFLLALLLSTRWIRAKSVWQTLLITPLAIPPYVAGTLWKILYHPAMGPISVVFDVLGMGPPLWLSDSRFALASVIIIDVWQWTSFVFIVLLAGMRAIPDELLEMSMIDGASLRQRTRYIIFPHLKLLLLVVLFFRLVDTIKIFDPIMASSEGGPGFATETLSMYIYRQGFKAWQIGYAAALSIFLYLIILAVGLFLFERIWRERGA